MIQIGFSVYSSGFRSGNLENWYYKQMCVIIQIRLRNYLPCEKDKKKLWFLNKILWYYITHDKNHHLVFYKLVEIKIILSNKCSSQILFIRFQKNFYLVETQGFGFQFCEILNSVNPHCRKMWYKYNCRQYSD